jgi:hypothetical protein
MTIGTCNTCGAQFERTRPRQQKCNDCFYGNRYVCGGRGNGSIFTRSQRDQLRKLGCGKPFIRRSGELLCGDCISLMDAVPPTAENYKTYLNAHGLYEAVHMSIGRGQHVGDSRLTTFAVMANMPCPADVASMESFWGPHPFEEWWGKLTGLERQALIQQFINASPAKVEAATGINRGTICKYQQRAAVILSPNPSSATARQFLGVTADDLLNDVAREIDRLFKMAAPAASTRKTQTDNAAIQTSRLAA